MTSQPVLFPVVLVADTDPLVRAVAAYLARFKDATRVHTESDLRAFLVWCPPAPVRLGMVQSRPEATINSTPIGSGL